MILVSSQANHHAAHYQHSTILFSPYDHSPVYKGSACPACHPARWHNRNGRSHIHLTPHKPTITLNGRLLDSPSRRCRYTRRDKWVVQVTPLPRAGDPANPMTGTRHLGGWDTSPAAAGAPGRPISRRTHPREGSD
ncbi:hypothetical protein PCASD_17535 [Puccinia coronata f. sp. avenae]|uniref:Uncharacterized protein n=1 Tax=Puccinia coronata f. sp. avenae TaxID=200324 RepID=A0A2N5U3V8_9BASI|nr:hypothetical protein PCASD_17535 [Puccinia coronata f. sp. avenae]